MSIIPARKRGRSLGTRTDPWDNLFLVNNDGQPVSLKDALLGVDRGGGFFHRDSFGVNVMFDPEGVAAPSPNLPTGITDYVAKPYTGNDEPGTGENTLQHGQLRQWTTVTTGGTKTYILVRTMSGEYRAVEATSWND